MSTNQPSRKVSFQHNLWSVDQFINKCRDKTYLDEAWQRPFCWEPWRQKSYINSLLQQQQNFVPITLVNVAKSLYHSREMLDERSINYYECLLAKNPNIEKINTDGNNRTVTLFEFVDDCFSISGHFNDGNQIFVVKDKVFSELEKDLQYHFLHGFHLCVTDLVPDSVDAIKETCLHMNSNDSWNAAERRNCKFGETEIIKWAREQASLFADSFMAAGCPSKQFSIQRRNFDEFALRMLKLRVENFTGDQQPCMIDNWVKQQTHSFEGSIMKAMALCTRDFERALDILQIQHNHKIGSRKQNQIFNIFRSFGALEELNCEVVDSKEWATYFESSELKRLADICPSAKELSDIRNDADLSPAQVADAIRKQNRENYYEYSRNTQEPNNEKSFACIKYSLENDMKKLLESNILKKVAPKKTYFSKMQKAKAWVKQGGNCYLTAKKLSVWDLYDGEKVHGDHVIPQAEGGPTVQENCGVTTAKANRTKGATLLESHEAL